MFRIMTIPKTTNFALIREIWAKESLSIEDTKNILLEMLEPQNFNLLFDEDDQSFVLTNLKTGEDVSVSDFINEHIAEFLVV